MHYYPTDPVVLSKEITLRRINNTNAWEKGQIRVVAILSDNSTETIMNWGHKYVPAEINIGENGIIKRNSAGSGGEITITYMTYESEITVYVSSESVAIVSLNNMTLTNTQISNEKTITIEATLSDGVVITDLSKLFPFNESYISLTSTPSTVAAAMIDSTLMILENHHSICTLTAAVDSATISVSFIANLQADAVGELDIGQSEGIPQSSVTPGSEFTTDIRINRGSKVVSALEIILMYDPTILRVISVTPIVKGFTAYRTRSPEGVIKLASSSVVSFGYEGVPTIAQVQWENVAVGETAIEAEFIIVDENLNDFAMRGLPSYSLPILVTSVDKRSVHEVEKRSPFVGFHGDINDDDALNVIDVANLTRILIGKIPTPDTATFDTNFDLVLNIFDMIYLMRAATGLVPYLTGLPSVTSVSSSSGCLLTLTANVYHTSESSVYLFFLISDNSTNFNDLVYVTQVVQGHEKSVEQLTGIFEANQTSNTSFTVSLFTPLSYKEGNIGVSILLFTADQLSETSLLRIASFTGSPSATVSSPKLTNFNVHSSAGNITFYNIQLGQEDTLHSLDSFTNDLRSDYCKFDGSKITVPSIPENYTTNMSFFNLTAAYPGFPIDEEVYYNFTMSFTNLPFNIEYPNHLIVSGVLDFDTGMTFYSFGVYAINSARNEIIGSATVTVNITDVNDNAPRFDNNIYMTSIAEGLPAGTFVIQVSAQDDDTTDINNIFTYSINPASDPGGKFSINDTTGVITLADTLDRETNESHILTVYAIDTGTPPQTGTTRVIVTVDDINDNNPVFSSSHYTFEVPEDIYNGANGTDEAIFMMSTISVTDADDGENKVVTLSLIHLSNETVGLFDITDDGYLIVLNYLDRETKDHYNVIVQATDNGTLPRTSTANLTILVTDINDNAPVFEPSENNFVIEDDLSLGTIIITIKATDADIGSNANITYSISENGVVPEFFEIDPSSGKLFVKTTLIVEEGDQITITVTASDMGVPEMKNKTTITITVVEGQIIVFDAGKKGFLVDEHTRTGDASYSQKIGYLFGEELSTGVQINGRVGTAFSRDFENTELANVGGQITKLKGRILQNRVYHSMRTVTVFVQLYDDRDAIAQPTLVRALVVPSSKLANLNQVNPIAYCTTSMLGYCVARVMLPDAWFERNTTNTATDFVTVSVNMATSTNKGYELGVLPVEASPVYNPTFLASTTATLVQPSHTLYTTNSFVVPLYVKSPLQGTFYTHISGDVVSNAVLEGYNFGSFFSCSKQEYTITTTTKA